jgi:nucleoid-associated protein YgaU
MKKKLIYIFTFLILNFNIIKANEPFVVLEYNKSIDSDSKQLDRDNPFLRNSSYNTMHKVEAGDSLSGIINKYYANTGLNKKIIEVSIIEINSKAFVKKNPHYLFAGKNIKIPSINEIMQLVKNKPSNENLSSDRAGHIYFFGGN